MAVVGGGVIGLEMGSVWSRLGSQVTVIEFLDRLCPSMDVELTKKFQTVLKKQGFKFQLKTKVTNSVIEADGSGVTLTTEPSKGGDSKSEKYDLVLVATGRRPYTDGLGLSELGIQTDPLGRIQVDEHFRTAVPSIYAIGDCINGPMLAHKAEEEGIAAVEIIAGFAGHVNYDAIPGTFFSFFRGGDLDAGTTGLDRACHFLLLGSHCVNSPHPDHFSLRNRCHLYVPRSRCGR